MATYEERRDSFAQYLKNRQVESGYIPKEVVDELPNEDMLESYRKNHEDGSDLYTEAQEHGVIMEYSTNEAIFQALEGIKDQNHLDTTEKRLSEEFSGDLIEVHASNINATSALAKLDKIGLKVSQEDVELFIKEGCSFFPQWIMEGDVFYVREPEPGKVTIDSDSTCAACLLNETLHKFKTLRVWAHHTNSGEAGEMGLKNCDELLIGYLSGFMINFVLDKNIEFRAGKVDDNVFSRTLMDLFSPIYLYIADLPLITCWKVGKDLAQDRVNKNEEVNNFLSDTHEFFCKKYSSCIVESDRAQYLKDLNVFLSQLSIEQLEILIEIGIPIDMTKSLEKKTHKIIHSFIDKSYEQEIKE